LPKALPDFDTGALCEQVLKQDIGLAVQTNDPETFKRRMYVHMSKHPEHKLRILAGPSASSLLLVKIEAVPAHA
jgi:hypothetical protein